MNLYDEKIEDSKSYDNFDFQNNNKNDYFYQKTEKINQLLLNKILSA